MAKTLSVRVGTHLADALEEHLSNSMYLNRSDFLREALREKLARDAPDLAIRAKVIPTEVKQA